MIEPVLGDALPSLLGAMVVPEVIVIATLAIDWRLGLAALATLLIAVPVFVYTDRTFIDLAATRQRRQASAVARMLEYVNGISVIRSYNQTGARMARFRDALDAYSATNLQLVHKMAPLLTAVTTTIDLGFAVVLLAAVYLVTGSGLATATVVVFLVLALRIYQPISAIVAQAELLRVAQGSLDRVAAVLELGVQRDPEHPRSRDGFEIRFDDVDCAYDAGTPDEKQVLDGVSFCVPEGR